MKGKELALQCSQTLVLSLVPQKSKGVIPEDRAQKYTLSTITMWPKWTKNTKQKI